jgi:Reverse transcriptase (RNA-dependent DNA polymerase)
MGTTRVFGIILQVLLALWPLFTLLVFILETEGVSADEHDVEQVKDFLRRCMLLGGTIIWNRSKKFTKRQRHDVCLVVPPFIYYRRAIRFPKQYHLRRKIASRARFLRCGNFDPGELQGGWGEDWDHAELCQDLETRYLHEPLIQYGTFFYRYTASLDPLLVFELLRGGYMQLRSDPMPREKQRIYVQACESVDKLFKAKHHSNLTRRVYINRGPDGRFFPIVIDTGATVSITPVKSDFVGELRTPNDEVIKGLTSTTKIAGYGRVRWMLKDCFGDQVIVETDALYIPEAEVRLFSPQTWFQEQRAGQLLVTWQATYLDPPGTTNQRLTFPYFHANNLPMAFDDPQMALAIEFGSFTSGQVNLSVADETNQNLTRAQKELLLWHWKLGHAGFAWVQQLLREPQDGSAPVIQVKNKSASSCPAPLCAACQLARKTRTGAGVSTEYKDPDKEFRLKIDDLEPGNTVSMDQYQSPERGRLPNTYGKEKEEAKYGGGTIFIDHASTKIYVRHQVSLRAGETVQAKREFEQDAAKHGVRIKKYHADNGVFDSKEFSDHMKQCDQTIDFSGSGAHHQNGVAERGIRTVTEWARAMLLHAALHWPEQATIETWPFALDYAVYIWNNLPKRGLKISPLELFSKTRISSHHMQRTRVWGCPTYVLDPVLQDGKKLPKWNPRSRRGQFLGLSSEHSSNIGLILNLRTGYVSPQFHVVYDDLFQTVPNAENGGLPFDEAIWDDLFRNQRERYIDEDEDAENIPPLHQDWLDPDEIDDRQAREHRRFARRYGRQPGQVDPEQGRQQREVQQPVAPPAQNDEGDAGQDEQEDPAQQQQDEEIRRSQRTRRPRIRLIEEMHSSTSYLSKRKVRTGALNNAFLNDLDWSSFKALTKSADLMEMVKVMQDYTDPKTGLVEEWHPMAFASLANASDNPNYHQAMNGPDSDGYRIAMEQEIDTLLNKDSWQEVNRTSNMNVLDSTWAFKCKRFPDGSVRKLKARFCVRGDQQIEGVDFFDTYAPVVQWSTVRLLLMISLMMGLATQQVDYTCAFLHAPIHEDVYCEMPRGFRKQGKVLKLKRSLYGLKQSPKNFFDHLKSKLTGLGFEQSDADPCLFIHDKVICLTYVDDCLLFSPNEQDITDMISRLRTEAQMELNVEDDVAGFLGVKMDRKEDGTIELLQTGLIDRIIDAMGLEGANPKATPAAIGALPKDADGSPCNEDFNYASVVGMLMYLSGHSRPELGFAVHQCARYTHCPKRSHEEALKHIGRYLLGTRNRGLILKPSRHLKVDLYVDAAFAGLWGYEDKHDPACVKSRSGFVVFVGGCPIVWGSKLQTEIALSTMESEYIALSESLKHLLVIKRLVTAVSRAVQLDPEDVAHIMSTVFEDNTACLTLAKLEPPRMTPRSKHYAIKYHWFRETLEPNHIEIRHVDTDNQIADILTKSLTAVKFKALREKLMGW